MSLETFFKSSIINAQKSYEILTSKVSTGNLMLEEFEKLSRVNAKSQDCTDLNKNWKDNFTILMKYASSSPCQIDQRLKQFEIYLKIDNIKEIKMVLLEIKRKNKLIGDFQLLDKIAASVRIFRKTLNTFQSNIINYKSIFDSWTLVISE